MELRLLAQQTIGQILVQPPVLLHMMAMELTQLKLQKEQNVATATIQILQLVTPAQFALKATSVQLTETEFTVTQQHVQPQSTVLKELFHQLPAQIGTTAQTTRCVMMDLTSLLIK
jgi:hypothetical protein